MTEEDKVYNRLLSAIRSNPPLPEDPEGLTKDIMECIQQLPQKEKRKEKKLLYIVGWLSTIASVLLICFFVKELFVTDVNNVPDISQGENAPVLMESVWRPDILQTLPSTLNLAEKSEVLFPLRKKFRKERLTQRFLQKEVINN